MLVSGWAEANSLFYAAFEERNLVAMDAIWPDDADVACVHPGWPPICGRNDVMRSWKTLFDNSDCVTPVCDAQSARALGMILDQRLAFFDLRVANVYVDRYGSQGDKD